jgi:hypothetical protein
VISVAAYPEVRRYQPPPQLQSQASPSWQRDAAAKSAGLADRAKSAPSAAAPAPAGELSSKRAARAESKALDSAGTGYGHEEYSPVQIVAFEPEGRAAETIHFKYEWRTTLCRLGVISCDVPPRRQANRMWDNGGYAPPPPGIR